MIKMDTLAGLALVLGCLAAIDDLRRRAISNWISIPGIAAGLLYHTVQQGTAGLALAAGGAAVGFALFFAFYWLGAMGGGDLKLMAAFGSLLGPSGILVAALMTAMAGGLIALGSIALDIALDRRRRAIPYGPAIVIGAWLSLLSGR